MRRIPGAVVVVVTLLVALAWCGGGLVRLRPRPGSEAILSARSAELAPGERAALLAGRLTVLDGRTALRWAAAGRSPQAGQALVVVNTPAVFPRGGDDGAQVLAITAAAVRLGARLMVDCTDADLARLTPAGRRSIALAKRAGLWRLVVFDGAHHVPSLAADPEFLLVPVMQAGGWPLIVHGYVRDALPLPQLLAVIRALRTKPVVFTLPRLSLPLKEPWPLGLVARLVLRRAVEAPPRKSAAVRVERAAIAPGPDGFAAGAEAGPGFLRLPGGRLLAVASHGLFRLGSGSGDRSARGLRQTPGRPEAPDGPKAQAVLRVGWPLSVWDLLLHHPASLAFGRALPWAVSSPRWDLSDRPSARVK